MKHLKALFAPAFVCAAFSCTGWCLQDNNTEVSCKFFEKAEALTDPANLPLPKPRVRGSPPSIRFRLRHMNAESRLVLRAVRRLSVVMYFSEA